jgi:hypothetical protein
MFPSLAENNDWDKVARPSLNQGQERIQPIPTNFLNQLNPVNVNSIKKAAKASRRDLA